MKGKKNHETINLGSENERNITDLEPSNISFDVVVRPPYGCTFSFSALTYFLGMGTHNNKIREASYRRIYDNPIGCILRACRGVEIRSNCGVCDELFREIVSL
jgi:hypothetical protein